MVMATTVNPSVFGRGRGRGRGLRAANTTPRPGPSATTQNVPINPPSSQPAVVISAKNSSTADVNSTVVNIIKRMNNLTESEIMETLLTEILAINDKETIEEFVKALSVKAISDPSFGGTAAKVASRIWNDTSSHLLIRNPLLKQTQADYTKRDKLSKEKYYGLCVYVSELFKYLRVKNTPLLPVGEAVVQLLKELMQKNDVPSDEDVLYFYQQLESVGSVIEECLPVRVEEIINIGRQMVISTNLLPSIRCRLVQLIELHAAKWQMSDELKVMYEDMQQDLISEGK